MRFIEVQKRQWEEHTKGLDDWGKVYYYCNTKNLRYIGVEFEMVYSALNCRIKRLIKKLELKNDWRGKEVLDTLKKNTDMFGYPKRRRKISIEDFY